MKHKKIYIKKITPYAKLLKSDLVRTVLAALVLGGAILVSWLILQVLVAQACKYDTTPYICGAGLRFALIGYVITGLIATLGNYCLLLVLRVNDKLVVYFSLLLATVMTFYTTGIENNPAYACVLVIVMYNGRPKLHNPIRPLLPV